VIQAFTIMLREGVESFIVVAIIATYLIKTNRRELLPAAWIGVAASVLATAYGTWLLSRFGESPLQEGVMCLIAAALTGTMVIWMWKTGRSMRRDIEQKIQTAATRTGKNRLLTWPALGVFSATFILLAREGAEAAFLLVSLVRTSSQQAALIGAVLGLTLALGMGILWIQNSKRMNLGMFFQVTGVFLLIFVG
jgi:high-affinity iron transporter